MTIKYPLTIDAGRWKELPANYGLQLNASVTGQASLNVPHGTAPSSPVNGDFWSTTSGFFGRVNGVTVGPFGAGGGSPGGSSGQVQWNNAGSFDGFTLGGDATLVASTGVLTIATNAVTDAKFRQSAGLSVVGRSANSTGNTADITAASDGQVLRRAGTSIGFGTVATAGIADDAVTYAKLQNVSATSRILGRKTASAGDAEECTLSEVLDFIGSAAQGDILYRGASAWARLAAGTSGQVLQTNGASANPSWVTPAGGGGTVTSAPYEAWAAPPTLASFSWVNQGSTTAADSTYGLTIQAPASGSNNLILLVKSAPTAPYDVVLRMEQYGGAAVSFIGTGIALRNSSSGKLVIFYLHQNSGVFFGFERWNSATSFSATAGGTGNISVHSHIPPRWMRVNVTSTTITIYYSSNGHDWGSALATESLSSFITSVDQVGIVERNDNGALNTIVNVFSTALL